MVEAVTSQLIRKRTVYRHTYRCRRISGHFLNTATVLKRVSFNDFHSVVYCLPAMSHYEENIIWYFVQSKYLL